MKYKTFDHEDNPTTGFQATAYQRIDTGEVVIAYVVGEADPKELDSLCLAQIARFKRPKDYVFIDALPKNNYGKVLKTELREKDAVRSETDLTVTSPR